jgi:hypothetical protein
VTTSVGLAVGCEMGACGGCAPQADNNPTIKTNSASFAYTDFIFYVLLKTV